MLTSYRKVQTITLLAFMGFEHNYTNKCKRKKQIDSMQTQSECNLWKLKEDPGLVLSVNTQ